MSPFKTIIYLSRSVRKLVSALSLDTTITRQYPIKFLILDTSLLFLSPRIRIYSYYYILANAKSFRILAIDLLDILLEIIKQDRRDSFINIERLQRHRKNVICSRYRFRLPINFTKLPQPSRDIQAILFLPKFILPSL